MQTELESMLIRHEGLKLKPYRCPAGRLTIGVGRNIDDNGITETEALFLLENDIAAADDTLHRILGRVTTQQLDEPRRAALIDMAFNLGAVRFARFKNLIAAVKVGDWFAASQAMQDSRWAKQVPKRAAELCWMMRNGEWWREA